MRQCELQVFSDEVVSRVCEADHRLSFWSTVYMKEFVIKNGSLCMYQNRERMLLLWLIESDSSGIQTQIGITQH